MLPGTVYSTMSTAQATDARGETAHERRFPAYGPIDALLTFALFYVVVDRATPTVVDVVTDVLPSVSPSLVGLGLAAFLWFVLLATLLDQGRRQLVALGVIDGDVRRPTLWSAVLPTGASTVAYLVVLLLSGALAWRTFDRAIATAVSVIRWIAALDFGAFVSVEFLVLVVFFVAFGLAAASLDRLVIGGIRAVLAS